MNLDKDKSGSLSREELLEGYRQQLEELDAEKEVDEIIRTIDVNGSGEIDFTEFITATIDKKKFLTNPQ